MLISILMRCDINHYNYPANKSIFLNYVLLKPLFALLFTFPLLHMALVVFLPSIHLLLMSSLLDSHKLSQQHKIV